MLRLLQMRRTEAIVFLGVLLVLCRPFCAGQQTLFSSGEIQIKAMVQEQKGDRIYLSGAVEVHYRNLVLFADSVEINTETKDAVAVGHVSLHLPGEEMSCEQLIFNLDSSEGELKKVLGRVQPSVFYEAESIRRDDIDTYRLEKAKITSCTQPVPRWNFSTSRATFKKDDYIEMWNPVFSIKKVPVLYLPYLRYPLERERSTGFLMPQVGLSGVRGFTYSQSFYWVMARNMDATVNVDYYSAKGIGGGLEYRYLFPKGTSGTAQLYTFNFNREAAPEDSRNAYIFRMAHNQPLPAGISMVADIDYQSSFDFLREFDNSFQRALVSNRRSQVYVSKAWSYFNFNMRLSRFETYFRQQENSIVRNTFPEISFSSTRIKLFSPLYFSFDSGFSRWEYGWKDQYEEDRQRRSQQLGFSPMLSLPFSGVPWFTVDSSLAGNLNYYFQSYAPGTSTIVDEPLLSKNIIFNTDFVGPVFYKIYELGKKKTQMKHIVEPAFTYRYESPVADSDRIITSWFFTRNHFVRYALTNRFIVNEDDMPREMVTLGVWQTYYIDEEESPLQVWEMDGEVPKLDELNAFFRFYPSRKYSLDFSAGYNVYREEFSRLRLGANLGTPADNVFLRVNWYKSTNPYYENLIWERHQIGFFGGFKIPAFDAEAQVELDYNIQERELLYAGAVLVYKYQCLDFRADLRLFFFREKPEVQFQFSFGLGNIGKTTNFLGGLEF